MKNNILIVDGQHLNIKNSGGAGRYGKQLYLYLNNIEKFINFNVHCLNSNSIAEQDIRNIFNKPSVCNRLIRVFCKGFGKGDKSHFKYKNISLQTKVDTFLLHEITNYSAIDQIDQFFLHRNFFLLVTFLDIQDFFYPEYFTDKQLSQRRHIYSLYKERADYFFAISNFTKQTMIDYLGIPSEKIIVTHLAADDLILSEPSSDIIKKNLSLGRYWIYPAKAWPHKNHYLLFQALETIKDVLYQKQVKFILTGGFKNQEVAVLKKNIHDSKLDDIVYILGFMPDGQLQSLIKGAEYLIFPSLFEGFGMPILEAMTLGCPVISSNAGSLPEVGGDAAIYFDPKNKEQFSALLESLLLERGVDRNLMIQKGLENSKRFSWDTTFRKTVEVYKTLLQ